MTAIAVALLTRPPQQEESPEVPGSDTLPIAPGAYEIITDTDTLTKACSCSSSSDSPYQN
jgi:hypothetical protein